MQRENKLMVTAWYDLTTRIQSNNVIVQRRSDARKQTFVPSKTARQNKKMLTLGDLVGSWIRQARQAALGTIPRR